MRPLVVALLAGAVVASVTPALARGGGGAPRTGRDACQTEADQIYRGIQNTPSTVTSRSRRTSRNAGHKPKPDRCGGAASAALFLAAFLAAAPVFCGYRG